MTKTSPEYIQQLLQTNNRAVERGIVVLYNRQTHDEKIGQTTKHLNSRGFSAADARRGTYMARWILNGNKLTGHWLDVARNMCLKYMRQLVEEAEIKQTRVNNELLEERICIQSESISGGDASFNV